MPNPRPITWLLVLAVALIGGCASTQVVHTWKVPEAQQPLGRTLVLGLFNTESVRRSYEDQMTAALQAEGLEATPATPLLPQVDMTAREKVDEVLQDSAFDHVLVTRMVSVSEREHWVSTPAPMPPHGYRGLSGYYWGAVPGMYSPGYITQDTIVLLETNIYRVSDEALIWSATSETFNPGDVDQEIQGLVEILTEMFRDQGLV